jgi:hypothetical protein
MYYRPMSRRLDLAINLIYYQEKFFGIDLVKVQINIIDSPSVVVTFVDKKIIHSQFFCLLNMMYEM